MVFRYAVQIDYPDGGGPAYNLWHLRGDTIGADVQLGIDAIQGFYNALLAYYQGGAVITGPDEVTAGIEGGSPTFEAVDGFSLGPVAGTSTLAPVLQAVVGWRTASATRSGRGRTFVGPLAVAASDADGTPSGGFITAMQNAAQVIVDNNDALDTGAVGVWSPTQNLLRDITGYRVRDVFAVLRSRR
jgi:hypothetical protein